MHIKILDLSENKARFIVYNINAAFANGIRRSMISEVPKIAIEYLKIYNNTSVLYDEQLGLRMTLVPLKMNQNYIEQSKCSCNYKGCPICEVSLRLDAKGPKMVYSGDIISSDPNVMVTDKNIPLIKLKEGQVIMLEAFAHVGYGMNHVRWQVGIACGYKNMPIININNCDGCGSCVPVCSKKIIEIINNKAFVSNENTINCSLCKLCEKSCDLKDPAIKISYDESTYIFTLESDGSYDSYELILKASEIIREKVLQLKSKIENI